MGNNLSNVNDNWIYQGNRLIEASYSLTVLEQKLIRVLASMIRKEDTDFTTYEFKAKDLSTILNINIKNIYKELDSITDKLMGRFIKIKDDDKEKFQKRHVIEVADFENGILTLKIHKDMMEFYMKLNWYTKYQLKNVMQFKSTYSFRIYELLKQYQNIGYRIIDIEELRIILDIGKNEYPRYANLKQKVLNVTLKEINEKTDIYIEFEEIKKSRKVTSIKYKIYAKTNNMALEEVAATKENNSTANRENLNEPIKEIMELMKIHNVTALEATQIHDNAKGNMETIKECYDYCKSKNIDNLIGYMITIVKSFNKPKSNIKKDNFNNFEQRQYDFDDLEKKLLGWDK